MNPKGTLIPIGGNENKGLDVSEKFKVEFIDDGILARVVKESGGMDANILVLPMASSIPVEVGKNYLDAFKKLGCTNVKVLQIKTKEDALKQESLDLLNWAKCVMFSGGDQSKIVRKIRNTEFEAILKYRYLNEVGFVIAGTSAGAMAMSKKMIAGGSSSESFFKGAVNMKKGLGILPNVIIDTHFIQRGRFGRVAEAIAINPKLLGLGLAEDTGLVIKGGVIGEVIGSGMVIVFDGLDINHNNHSILKENTPLTLTNLRVHVLAIEDKLDLDKRTICVLPYEQIDVLT